MWVVILVIAAVLLARWDRVLMVTGLLGTTEVGEVSSSDEDSCSCLAFLLTLVARVDRGAGVGAMSMESSFSRLISSSNLPAVHMKYVRTKQNEH